MTAPACMPAAANMRQLVALRWIAIAGQATTIAIVHALLGVPLPLAPMVAVLVAAILVNLASTRAVRHGRIGQRHLLAALLFDLASLAAQLALAGGVANPFVPLFLLQVGLGATLLDRRGSAIVATCAIACFALLTVAYVPLAYPPALAPRAGSLALAGAFLCFVLVAGLLVLFVARIAANLRAQDARLTELGRRAAEEEHIVRMGLLATGAAHELGTPLATLAVILNDWQRLPVPPEEMRADAAEMRVAVDRLKAIVGGILRSVGEPRGEAPEVVPLAHLLDGTAAAWRAAHPHAQLDYRNGLPSAPMVVADRALHQTVAALLDNAADAGARRIELAADGDADTIRIAVRDDGAGFPPAFLPRIGEPYLTSKPDPGHGLGLFLAGNVARTLGGSFAAADRPGGGAEVTIALPLAAIALPAEEG
ncbi:MAG: ATP-binding protein [Sphingomonas fennica]